MFSISSARATPALRAASQTDTDSPPPYRSQDAVFGDRAHVRRVAANGQDAARHMRVERLHTPVEHLGNPVTSATSFTGTPPSRISRAVPPVEMDLRSNGMERRGEFQTPDLSVDAHQNALILAIPATITDLHRGLVDRSRSDALPEPRRSRWSFGPGSACRPVVANW